MFDAGGAPLDTAVARAKFEEQIRLYRAEECSYHARGCWLLHAEFPRTIFAFAHPILKPTAVLFGAEIDFSNYDLWPLSVRFVQPFTRVPYKPVELPTRLARAEPTGALPLIQFHTAEDTPFLCLAGVREYHQHPAHTGDSWFLHRGTGKGTLPQILNVLLRYGVESVREYQFAIRIECTGHKVELLP
jgi:hypothetical protein